MELIDLQLEDDHFLVASPFSEDFFPEVGIIEQEEQNLLRRSLAWDSAFFNSAGVLDQDELFFMNKGLRKAEPHVLPGSNDIRNRSFQSGATHATHDFSTIYNPITGNALKVFDKSPELGPTQKGVQDVQASKKVGESSRSKMKSYQTYAGRNTHVQSEGKTRKEPTPRRRTPSPLPQKAIRSTTNISTKVNIKENISGKSYLKMDKRSTTSCSTPSFSKRETAFGKSHNSASIPTSKIWRYSGGNKEMWNDINSSKEASALKGSLQSSFSSAKSHLSTQTLRPSGLRPPSPHTRFSHENSAPSYQGETRTRKLPQKAVSKETTFGHDSSCKKLKTPCSDVPRHIKRPKIESSKADQEKGVKKPSYSYDHLENLSRYFEAIDLNKENRVNCPSKLNKMDVGNRGGVPFLSVLKQEKRLLNSVASSSKACQMRTPLSDKTFSCNFSGTVSVENKRVKLAKKASSVYATSKVPGKENI